MLDFFRGFLLPKNQYFQRASITVFASAPASWTGAHGVLVDRAVSL
jgi:hypothetical protein